jgi:hypothetical protein
MEYVPFEPGIEVNGQTVNSVVKGFGMFKKIPSDFLLAVGIGRPGPDGFVSILDDEWLSQALWLQAFRQIGSMVGMGAIHGIGLKIPECAIFPAWVTDVSSAIRSIDVAYHLNHRKEGKVMFDVEDGTMTEGIGHYGYTPDPGAKRILSTCNNPYPCDLDRGILTAMALRFAPDARIEHVDPDVCRKKGADACTYLVSWG